MTQQYDAEFQRWLARKPDPAWPWWCQPGEFNEADWIDYEYELENWQ